MSSYGRPTFTVLLSDGEGLGDSEGDHHVEVHRDVTGSTLQSWGG